MVVAIAVAVIAMVMTMMLVFARHIADLVDLETLLGHLSARGELCWVDKANKLCHTHMLSGRRVDVGLFSNSFSSDVFINV